MVRSLLILLLLFSFISCKTKKEKETKDNLKDENIIKYEDLDYHFNSINLIPVEHE